VKYGAENRITVELKAGNWGNKATDFDQLPRTITGDRDFTGRKGYNPRASGRIIKPWVISGGSGAEMFFSIGMWQPVRMEVVPRSFMERPFMVTKSIGKASAQLHFSTEVFVNRDALQETLHPWHNISIKLPAPGKPSAEYTLRLELMRKGRKVYAANIPLQLHEGRNWVEKDIALPSPELWNPVGLGDPALYEVRCALMKNGRPVDEMKFDFGVRTVERVAAAGPRLSDRWENWQFVVNGKKVFVKGMNFTPQDVLLETDGDKYRWALSAAKKMGVQMIRVWGGGLLETDEFYRICNEMGLMVWQDFPIGNQDTPDYPQDVWEAQVVQNIFRLRNHPSLVVWCGGNEFNPYSKGNAATIGIVERNLQIFDNSRLFLRTTPDAGSVHVYPDMDPALYAKSYAHVPWMSETGMHSMPEAALLHEVVVESELSDAGRMWDKDFSNTNPDFVHHFAEYGPARVPRMLSRASHFTDVNNATIEQLSTATQAGAGEFYQVLSEKMQGNYPITTGLMPWVFKRHWPVIAIQFMDWFGHAGIPYYFMKRTYEPLHVAADLPRLCWAPGEEMPLAATVTSALPNAAPGHRATIKVYDDHFNELHKEQWPISAAAGPSVSRTPAGAFTIPPGYRDRFLYLVAELHNAGGRLVSRSVYYPRSLALMEDTAFFNRYAQKPEPWPTLGKGPWLMPTVAKTATRVQISKPVMENVTAGQSVITVTVSNTGRYPACMASLNITGAQRAIVASDNYYWLAAGESRRITLDVWWRSNKDNASLELSAWNAERVSVKLK